MSLYLDSHATTPLDPRVREVILRHLDPSFGNAGSTHEFGQRGKDAVNAARDQIARVVHARRHEVVLTSGATESNNLALLGLAAHGERTGRRHLVSTEIEHKAVLEPLAVLQERGFEVTLVPAEPSGRVAADAVLAAVRPDTLLVSVMQVNNETGIAQPVDAIAAALGDSAAFLHVDAAQGYGKDLVPLTHDRIDLISVSAHKIHGPQGVGCLIARRRAGILPPLEPIIHGGGQEFGLRSGSLPVALIAGFGLAAELAADERNSRHQHCVRLKKHFVRAFTDLGAALHGDAEFALPNALNMSLPGLDSDQALEALAGVAAVSDGAACTTICATASHVLASMGVTGAELDGAVRLSWSHLTPESEVVAAIPKMVQRLQAARAPHDVWPAPDA
ncbi:Cysteine desulfurase [Posidoniimonas polymericola]|uniref:cysteine desulfurase n=1 Tax=Posidoniimonas polymericola TaxID=2528002 RepID=A0A5C5YLG0_9BACT|nr:aminotransferase class V-fold PLP-dependent enzyme [Posidoniimonas polymericola]TWT75667.1 Cysteine desulfurase [Posidoniimonas polymericola]